MNVQINGLVEPIILLPANQERPTCCEKFRILLRKIKDFVVGIFRALMKLCSKRPPGLSDLQRKEILRERQYRVNRPAIVDARQPIQNVPLNPFDVQIAAPILSEEEAKIKEADDVAAFTKQYAKSLSDKFVGISFEEVEKDERSFVNFLQNHLLPFLKDMQLKNGVLISKLTNRVIDKLDSLDFKQIIDKPVNILNRQMSAYAASAKMTETLATKQRNVFLANAGLPASASERDIINAKATYLLTEFSKQQICLPVIKDTINSNMSHEAKVKKISRMLERNVAPILAENLMQLIFPNKIEISPEGSVRTVDGFTDFCSQLKILDNDFQKLMSEFETHQKGLVIGPIISIIVKIAVESLNNKHVQQASMLGVKSTIQNMLTSFIQSQLSTFVLPERFDEMAANAILPSLRYLIISSIAYNCLYQSAGEMAPLFRKLIENRPESAQTIHQLVEKWFYVVNNSCALQQHKISYAAFHEMVLPSLQGIEEMLIKLWRSDAAFGDEHVTEALQVYLTGEMGEAAKYTSDEHDLYWKLFNVLILDLGQFGSIVKKICNVGWIKREITTSILSSIQIIRGSHHKITQLSCDTIRSKFANPVAMRKVLSGEIEPSESHAVTQAKLDNEILLLAQSVREFAISFSKGSWMASWFVKPVLGSVEDVRKLVDKLYQDILGDPLLNANLVLNMIKEVMGKEVVGHGRVAKRANAQSFQRRHSLEA